MTLEDIKTQLARVESVNFKLPSGARVPEHFHVTEVGLVTKHFIDCGGVERLEQKVNFQLWNADDFEHKLKPGKLLHIIALSQQRLGIGNLEIEVEYQSDTIGKYGLDFDGQDFLLIARATACLASDACGLPVVKQNIRLAELSVASSNACTPEGNCCS